MKKKTKEEFLCEFSKKFPTLTLVDEFTGMYDRIRFRCNVCDHLWSAIPHTIFYSSTGCRACAWKRTADKQRKTLEVFIEELWLINQGILVVGPEYVNNRTKIQVQCLECGHTWFALPSNLLFGYGCGKCANQRNRDRRIIPYKEFAARVAKLKFNMVILTPYAGVSSEVTVRCLLCGKIYNALPTNILKGKECSCQTARKISEALLISHQDFIDSINLDKLSISILSEYKNSTSKILVRCNNCDREWGMRPDHIRDGIGCPLCGKYKSSGELAIKKFLDTHNISYEPQCKFEDLLGVGGGLLSYDFYLKDSNLLIEYQGQYHDGTVSNQPNGMFLRQQEHDRRKKEYAEHNHIKLLEIWYQDYKNIETVLTNTLQPVTSIAN